MLRTLVLILLIKYVCGQSCTGITILSPNVSTACDCGKIISEIAYRGGVSPDTILTNAVTYSWNSTDSICNGCYTDPNSDFGSYLRSSTNFSDEMTTCYSGTSYNYYFANVSTIMADSDL